VAGRRIPTICWNARRLVDFQGLCPVPRYLPVYRSSFGPRLTVSRCRREVAKARPRPRRVGRERSARLLVTVSAGFIVATRQDLLRRDYDVVWNRHHSKYGPVRNSFDDDPRYTLVAGDAPRRRGAHRRPHRLRPPDRGCGADGASPTSTTRVRPLRRTSASSRRRVTPPSPRTAAAVAAVTYLSSSDGLREPRRRGRVREGGARRPAAALVYGSRSWRSSNSPGPRYDQHGLPYPSCARSTASVPARSGVERRRCRERT